MAEKKQDDQEVQQKMLRFQVLEGNLKAIRTQIEQTAVRAEELAHTKLGLEELSTVKSGDSAFVPVGAGTFVEGKVTDSENVLVSVGGGIAVKKSREEAIKFLDERLDEIQKATENMIAQERNMITELQRLQPELQRLLQGQ